MKNKAIFIKGIKWQVKYLHPENPHLEDNDGMCAYDKKTIYLSKKPSANAKNCYWHEYLHAFFWECGVRDMNSNFEHVLIENLADLLESVDV